MLPTLVSFILTSDHSVVKAAYGRTTARIGTRDGITLRSQRARIHLTANLLLLRLSKLLSGHSTTAVQALSRILTVSQREQLLNSIT
jgi:hypothetical protein